MLVYLIGNNRKGELPRVVLVLMVLRIDEAELRAKLFEHKEQIGFGPIANGSSSSSKDCFTFLLLSHLDSTKCFKDCSLH